jgi:hypothetical protein
MTVLQLSDGGLLLHSPIALPEDTMLELEKLGSPKLLFVANQSTSSRVDLKVYQKRYPESKIICPEGISGKMAEHVPVDGIAETVLTGIDSRFLFIEPPLKDLKGTLSYETYFILSI